MEMKKLNVKKYLREQNDKIEQALQQERPNDIVNTFSSLMTIRPFYELYYMARCLGVEFEYSGENIVTDGYVKFRVPSNSFLKDRYPLFGAALAKIVKGEMVYIFTHFCIRCMKHVQESDLNIRFKFIESGKTITIEEFEYLARGINNVSIHTENYKKLLTVDEKTRDALISSTHDLGTLTWYGIFIDAGAKTIEELDDITRNNDKLELEISVPDHSEFSINGSKDGEISGQNAYNFALSIINNNGIIKGINRTNGITTKCVIREGEIWTKETQAHAMKVTSTMDDLYGFDHAKK